MSTTIGERIQMVLTALNKKKVDFANDIGITSASVTTMCNGKSNPSNQTIMMMCKAYNVNEEWLRTGVGEMFLKLSVADEITIFAAETAKLDASDPRVQILRMLAQLPQEDWGAVADMIDILKNDKK